MVCAAEGPFRSVADKVREKCELALSMSGRVLKSSVDGILAIIRKDFNRMSTKTNDTPEGKLFRENLLLLVNETREILEGPTRKALDICRQHK